MADSPAAERRIDEDDVRALLRAQKDSAHLADLPLRQVAEGWDNAIWRLGDELAVRVPRRALASSLIRHEQRALSILGPRLAELGIRTPVPLVVGAPTEAFPWPWSVVPWIDGTPALGLGVRANNPWAPDLARALGTLHRPAPADAPQNPVRGVALAVRDHAMRTRLARLDETEPMRSAWDAGVAAPPASETVWIHGDLHPGNILIASGSLAALIDFGDVTSGDPAYDLAASWLLFDPEGRSAFVTAAAGRYDDDTWVRARAWAAYLTAVFLTESDDRPDLRALGERAVGELASP
ncbi:aminoglycoside phosphotransferase family protein [Microbacterium hydrocarbonoxydans]|uniref:aminoglycoside phosphotransferase family protein n=1 Tax=Microbacterium hydrocarbonoxydans TaxID=273678 RepID=UPI00203CED74|nr:aminoglycoside phosphotransferase family protein [Microbacterium hydrocarbonoxydans]MCM3779056.1 aminoglycoside phosphotransferase family protein [Microbacterium hydrocarbonoxydans]